MYLIFPYLIFKKFFYNLLLKILFYFLFFIFKFSPYLIYAISMKYAIPESNNFPFSKNNLSAPILTS